MRNVGKPWREYRHFKTAQGTPKHSNSIGAYLCSASERNLEPHCTFFHTVLTPSSGKEPSSYRSYGGRGSGRGPGHETIQGNKTFQFRRSLSREAGGYFVLTWGTGVRSILICYMIKTTFELRRKKRLLRSLPQLNIYED